MERLKTQEAVVIQQKKEWAEIITNFETRNRYVISDPGGQELYYAAEVAGSWLMRNFLAAWRPFTIEILDVNKQCVLRLKRPFTFFLHKVDVYDTNDVLLGSVQMRFSILRRLYWVYNEAGQKIFQLFGPILHPWTLCIQRDGAEIGKITKRWSGLLKEAYTDADNFNATFPLELEVKQKAILLGAVFLVDFVQFEGKR